MPEIRVESAREGLYAVFFGESVVVCDLTKADAEALVAAYSRLIH